MKKLGFLLLAVVLLVSCSEDVQELLPSMTATIDGKEWVSTVRATVQNDDKFVITGTALSQETLVITINGTSTGLYEFEPPLKLQCLAAYKETASADIQGSLAIEGYVNLTEVNTSARNISGTFEFKILKEGATLNVSNGKFSRIKYTITGN